MPCLNQCVSRRPSCDELDAKFNQVPGGAKTRVQFNPETLKVSFSNQLKGDDKSGTAAIQFVGAGATKLSLQLWFDVNAPQIEEPRVNDVRKLTQRVAYYMLPGRENKGATRRAIRLGHVRSSTGSWNRSRKRSRCFRPTGVRCARA